MQWSVPLWTVGSSLVQNGYMEPFTFTDTDTDTRTWGHPMSMTGGPKLFTDTDTDTDTRTCRHSYSHLAMRVDADPARDDQGWGQAQTRRLRLHLRVHRPSLILPGQSSLRNTRRMSSTCLGMPSTSTLLVEVIPVTRPVCQREVHLAPSLGASPKRYHVPARAVGALSLTNSGWTAGWRQM